MKHDINTAPVVKQLKDLKVGSVFETVPPKNKLYLTVKLDSSTVYSASWKSDERVVVDLTSDKVTMLRKDTVVQIVDNVRLTNKVD
ncbi:hypothetical protein PQC58_gp125 [Escherichia phage Paul]|uniref:Uncharacterized protein n=1 Tax=Escherichia phage Paul TaxID=2589659 RepID=A0A5B9N6K0_9CAUD|nr:hypothetical protein PQC58_gp125 [Escherichia phage Paul]QEG08216.1 hypothetical protein CPT_Paul_121 [Escherichia phage Paul]